MKSLTARALVIVAALLVLTASDMSAAGVTEPPNALAGAQSNACAEPVHPKWSTFPRRPMSSSTLSRAVRTDSSHSRSSTARRSLEVGHPLIGTSAKKPT